jgi:hypothetical protein
MTRSAEALKKRALTRNKTEWDQRKADSGDMQKREDMQKRVEMRKREEIQKREDRERTSPAVIIQKVGIPESRGDERHEDTDMRVQTSVVTTESPRAPKGSTTIPTTTSATLNPGDTSDPLDETGAWKCIGCGNHNFASRHTCNSKTCEEKRPTGTFAPPPRKSKPETRHDESTSKKSVWGQQAGSAKLEQNQDLRRQYLETGGEGMEEDQVIRAKILIERDERKKQTKDLKTKSKMMGKGNTSVELERSPDRNTNGGLTAQKTAKKYDPVAAKLEQNKSLRRQYLETGGEGMEEDQVTRAKILIERDERKKQKKTNDVKTKSKMGKGNTSSLITNGGLTAQKTEDDPVEAKTAATDMVVDGETHKEKKKKRKSLDSAAVSDEDESPKKKKGREDADNGDDDDDDEDAKKSAKKDKKEKRKSKASDADNCEDDDEDAEKSTKKAKMAQKEKREDRDDDESPKKKNKRKASDANKGDDDDDDEDGKKSAKKEKRKARKLKRKSEKQEKQKAKE